MKSIKEAYGVYQQLSNGAKHLMTIDKLGVGLGDLEYPIK